MKAFTGSTVAFSALLVVICLLNVISCSPPTASKFVAGFNPAISLSKVGEAEGIAYSKNSAGATASKDLFSGVKIHKDWAFSFQGSHAQLSKQLDQLRGEIESQLTSDGCVISGRGRWSGDFSGFSFTYDSSGLRGFIRVTGVSFESGSQGLEIFVYEH